MRIDEAHDSGHSTYMYLLRRFLVSKFFDFHFSIFGFAIVR
jgi:hypothetical protein